jgi:hypothetical protein
MMTQVSVSPKQYRSVGCILVFLADMLYYEVLRYVILNVPSYVILRVLRYVLRHSFSMGS